MIYKDKTQESYAIKSVPEHLKIENEVDGRIIKAVVNTYNYFDYDQDVLRIGAAKRSINNRGANSQAHDKILHALNHDLTQLPGKSLLEAEMKVNGLDVLYTESKLLEDVLGEQTLVRYLEKIYNQHSIGFRYKDITFIEEDSEGWTKFVDSLINPEDALNAGYGYEVKEIELFEWSTVPFGANKLTPYLGTKTDNKQIHIQNIYKKMDALIEQSKKGVKNTKIYELQYYQLKQLIQETINGSNEKQTAKQRTSQNLPENQAKLFYSNLK
jgi:hypothetical protein